MVQAVQLPFRGVLFVLLAHAEIALTGAQAVVVLAKVAVAVVGVGARVLEKRGAVLVGEDGATDVQDPCVVINLSVGSLLLEVCLACDRRAEGLVDVVSSLDPEVLVEPLFLVELLVLIVVLVKVRQEQRILVNNVVVPGWVELAPVVRSLTLACVDQLDWEQDRLPFHNLEISKAFPAEEVVVLEGTTDVFGHESLSKRVVVHRREGKHLLVLNEVFRQVIEEPPQVVEED